MNTFEKPIVEATPAAPPKDLLIEDLHIGDGPEDNLSAWTMSESHCPTPRSLTHLGREMRYLLSSQESGKLQKDGTKDVQE